MKLITIIVVLLFLIFNLYDQREKIHKAKVVIGLSAPGLLHLRITYRIANISLVEINGGLGPTLGGVWPALSFENRIYFGRNDGKTKQKNLFCRQGSTFFPSAVSPGRFTGTLTI